VRRVGLLVLSLCALVTAFSLASRGWLRATIELEPIEKLALVALVGTCASHLLLEANPRYVLPWIPGVMMLAAAAPRFTRTP
jgi:hypothetical protein